jgi:phosphoribosylformylglycinamidine (FGAM) synthase-like enzyme
MNAQIANNRRLFSGVVSGIAHYGNCFGIPTVAGEVYFDKIPTKAIRSSTPSASACCATNRSRAARPRAWAIPFLRRPGHGRDGLAGAAFASQDLTEESAEQQRGAVQVGDPFMEKLVCEACLELLATGASRASRTWARRA